MKTISGLSLLGSLALSCAVSAQTPADAVRSYIEAARTFAGNDHAFVFGRLCETPIASVNAPPVTGEVPAALPIIDPEREWYAEPAKVFDDLFFLGQTGFSVWGLRTTDGMEITLGNSTVKVFITPGHTHGTISTLLPVHDNGEPHVAAVWGGTLFNFRDNPDDPRDLRLRDYAQSAVHFQAMTAINGADVILSNHTAYDGTTVKLPLLNQREIGDPHPYVIGQDAVNRYLKVAESCAIAARIAEASGL